MKARFLTLLFLSLNSIADPFYADPEQSQAVENHENFAKKPSKQPACQPPHTQSLVLTEPFQQLKLVGIVQFGSQFRALFTDAQQRLVDLRIGDLISAEQIQIHDISLKQVRYIDWQKSPNCDKPTLITLNL